MAQRTTAPKRDDVAAARALDRPPGRHRGTHWLDSAIRRRVRVVESLTGEAGRGARQIRILLENLEHRRRYQALAEANQRVSWPLPGQPRSLDPITRRFGYSDGASTAEIETPATCGGLSAGVPGAGRVSGEAAG